MDSKKIKIDFHRHSNEVIKFLNNFERVTYVSTLLVENNNVSAHQSNGYAGWDQKFYYDGIHKDSLLIKIGLELTKIKGGDVSTVIWDDVLKNDVNNVIDEERRKHNIFHGISFIYGLTDNTSMAINVCTGEDTSKKDFEGLLFPMRFALLNYFKDL
ncbi:MULTISPECIES: hypothetical protein [Xenorhabdus]|uniref:hypothetical protein n=1 Tax=Xenorhabdus TaxID=626 RepID=UPI000C044FDA|nr:MULTISPECIES: hypothetical protein [unclassified Xenorhabdus]MCC8367686.1 hypothetical protein [Xenorhabdus sp. PB61.4]MCC8380707.1 hypothetical protein [Xenorhabdus sp. PB30.3]PHM59264.1 hypothetical protein Xekk_00564 [Xenorhabdus sp. KK7.4]